MAGKISSTKELIVSVAQRAFATLGFNKTTIGDIAKASNKGRRTIYTYFRNKEELYEAVVEKEIGHIISKLEGVVSSEASPDEKLRDFIFQRMQALWDLVNRNKLLKNDKIQGHYRVMQIRKNLDAAEKELLTAILQEGIAKKHFQLRNSRIIAQTLHHTLVGLEGDMIHKHNGPEFSEELNSLLEVLLFGMVLKKEECKL